MTPVPPQQSAERQGVQTPLEDLVQRALDKMASGDFAGGFQGFLNIAQFAEVGQGNMNWPALLPASLDAGAEFFFIEQDETYGRDPFDCIADSRAYLASIGY